MTAPHDQRRQEIFMALDDQSEIPLPIQGFVEDNLTGRLKYWVGRPV